MKKFLQISLSVIVALVTITGIAIIASSNGEAQNVGRQESPVYHASRPGDGSFLIVPSDSTVFSRKPRALYVTSAGDVKFRGIDGTIDTWTVPDNFYLSVNVDMVYLTGTTATGIHGIY